VVAYFASRREADADGNFFLTAVVPQLEDCSTRTGRPRAGTGCGTSGTAP
jgi:hypothetical protein